VNYDDFLMIVEPDSLGAFHRRGIPSFVAEDVSDGFLNTVIW